MLVCGQLSALSGGRTVAVTVTLRDCGQTVKKHTTNAMAELDLSLIDALTDSVPQAGSESVVERDFVAELEAETFDDQVGETIGKTDYIPLLDNDGTTADTGAALENGEQEAKGVQMPGCKLIEGGKTSVLGQDPQGEVWPGSFENQACVADLLSGFSVPEGMEMDVEMGTAPLPAERPPSIAVLQQPITPLGSDASKEHPIMLPEPLVPYSPLDLPAGALGDSWPEQAGCLPSDLCFTPSVSTVISRHAGQLATSLGDPPDTWPSQETTAYAGGDEREGEGDGADRKQKKKKKRRQKDEGSYEYSEIGGQPETLVQAENTPPAPGYCHRIGPRRDRGEGGWEEHLGKSGGRGKRGKSRKKLPEEWGVMAEPTGLSSAITSEITEEVVMELGSSAQVNPQTSVPNPETNPWRKEFYPDESPVPSPLSQGLFSTIAASSSPLVMNSELKPTATPFIMPSVADNAVVGSTPMAPNLDDAFAADYHGLLMDNENPKVDHNTQAFSPLFSPNNEVAGGDMVDSGMFDKTGSLQDSFVQGFNEGDTSAFSPAYPPSPDLSQEAIRDEVLASAPPLSPSDASWLLKDSQLNSSSQPYDVSDVSSPGYALSLGLTFDTPSPAPLRSPKTTPQEFQLKEQKDTKSASRQSKKSRSSSSCSVKSPTSPGVKKINSQSSAIVSPSFPPSITPLGYAGSGLNPAAKPFFPSFADPMDEPATVLTVAPIIEDKGDKNEKMTDNIMKVNLIDPLDQVEEKSGKAENTSSVTCISVDKATENNKDKPKETQKEDKIKENAMGKETEENKEKVEEKEKDVEEVKQEQSDTKKEKGEEFKKLEVKEQEIKFVKEVQKEMEREKDKELNEVEVKEKEIKWLEEQQKTEKERGGELKKVEVKDNEMEKVIEEQKGTEKDEGEDLKNVEVKDKEMEGVNKEQKETKKEKGGGFKKAEVMEKEMEGVLEEQKETEKYKGGELKKADVKDKEMEGVNKEQEETEKEKGGGFKKVKVMEKEMEGVEEDQKEIDKIELMQKMKKADEIIKVMESPAKSEKTGFGDLETKKKVEVAFETVKVEKAENIEKVQRSETSDVDEKVENKSTEQLGKEQDIGKVEETPEQQSAPVESSTGLDKLQNAMGTETKDKALSVETKKEKPDISNAKKPDKVDKMEKPSGTPAEKSVQKSQKEFKQDKIHGEKKTAEKKDGRKDKTTKADAAEKAKKPSKPAVNAQSTTQSKGLPSGDKKAKSAVGSTKTNTTAKMRPSATAASVGSAAATKKRPTLSSTTSTSDTLSKKPSTTKAPATTTVGPKKPATTSTSRPLNTATTCDVKPKVTSEKRPPVSKASTITSHQTGTTITKNGTASAAAKPATSLRTTASARTTTTASAKTALASKTDNKRGEQKKPSIPKTAPAEATKPKTTISRSTASTTTPTASRTRTTTSKPATISSSIGTLPEKKSSMSRTTRANSSTTTTTTTSTSRATARPTTAPAPDIRNARSKVGSTNNMKYQPGGGKITSASHNSVASKEMNQGKVQILNRKVDVSKVTSKCGSKDNLKHKPGGGDVKIESHKVNFKEKARSKVGSMDNVGHSPGGGNVKAEGAQETTEGTGTPLSGTSAPAPSPEPGQTWAPAAQENGLKGVALCDEGLQEPQGLDSCIPETSI
ncbi:microtubule-associated protein 4 isoform X1 [Thalassophryne amazonica]|uniref:microtubule-associated protein 4 isoform X1 n=1 Tax=Thalassophryne amazonica TaxID=390379 RepID=UPI001471CA40|nr:microtubule-associated protein 4 isoform X1 [Thalassophryne amazonica]